MANGFVFIGGREYGCRNCIYSQLLLTYPPGFECRRNNPDRAVDKDDNVVEAYPFISSHGLEGAGLWCGEWKRWPGEPRTNIRY